MALTSSYGPARETGGTCAPWADLGAVDLDRRAGAHLLEDPGVAVDIAEHVHRARRSDLGAAAGRRGTEEDAERGARRPVAEVAHLHGLARRLRLGLDGDLEVDLVAPCLAWYGERQRRPDEAGSGGIVQHAVRRHRARGDPDTPFTHRLSLRPAPPVCSSPVPSGPRRRLCHRLSLRPAPPVCSSPVPPGPRPRLCRRPSLRPRGRDTPRSAPRAPGDS